MKKNAFRRAAFIIIPLLLSVATAGVSTSQRRIGEILERSTVKVSTYDGDRLVTFGSGFIFDREGFVGTNFHVINEAVRRNYRLSVEFVGSTEKREAKIITWDTGHDFAVIKIGKIPGVELSPLAIGDSSQLRTLDTIYVAGFPVTGAFKAQRGDLNSTQVYNGRSYFDISPLIDSGNSGGPVLNGVGELVGISVAYVKMARSINLAVRSADIKNVISDSLKGKHKMLVRDGKAVEKNNSRDSANLIVVGMEIRGSLSAKDTVDWFELNGQEGTRPTLTITHGQGKDFDLEVYSDGLLTGKARGSVGSKSITCNVPGRCFLKVARVSGDGDYRVEINANRSMTDDGSEMENNNVRALANRTRSTTLSGNLDGNDTEDWFVLEGQEGVNPLITISHGEDANFDFEVYSGSTLAGRARGTGPTDSMSFNVPGQCYIRVLRVRGSGRYTITINRDGGTYEEQEPNNDRSMANLTRNLVIEGNLSENDGEDWFELAGQEGVHPSFAISHDASANFDFEVFSGNTPACRAVGTGPADTIRCRVPGRCFVRIWRVSGSGNYRFTIDPMRPRQRAVSPDGSAIEPNNSRETATLTRSMVLRGEISERDTEDWFELGGQEGTMPSFTISHGPDANFDFEVFSSNVLMCSAIGEGPTDSVRCSVPGRCFVRVWRVRGAGAYTITVTR